MISYYSSFLIRFQEENVFVGYNPDTAAAVVLQASADLQDQTTAIEGSDVFKKEVYKFLIKFLFHQV